MPPVISVENLSKKYIIGHQKQERYTTLRDVLAYGAKQFTNKLRYPFAAPKNDPTHEEFWALKDVSFDIQQGDRVGIIGRNGAGKSTLLKILSRITEPTSGKVSIKGRVASLLEVGTGFHPELTGRENIFLNGAILGMSKADIKRKFDEIVAFAEVEKFLDTPVKRYSSGMYVRLAFAVAAYLEPEILIVDEVLAVGDAQFQKKCLGKMEEVSLTGGRTVLFVSHQMGSIAQFCNKAFLLDRGEIAQSGTVPHVVNRYMTMSANNMEGFMAEATSRHKDIAIIKARSYDAEGNPVVNFTHSQEIVIVITCKVNNWVSGAEVRVAVRDLKRNVFTTDTELIAQNGGIPDELRAKVVIPAGVLRPEQYFFKLATYLPNQAIFDLVEDALSITVIDGGSKYAASEGLDYGCVFVECKWSIANSASSFCTKD
jgi:lipopolysaccharide transport system ATP-binding protein